MPVIADNLERAFAVDFFLQSPQRFFYWFAFFKFNFRQNILTSSPGTFGMTGFQPVAPLWSGRTDYFVTQKCQPENQAENQDGKLPG